MLAIPPGFGGRSRSTTGGDASASRSCGACRSRSGAAGHGGILRPSSMADNSGQILRPRPDPPMAARFNYRRKFRGTRSKPTGDAGGRRRDTPVHGRGRYASLHVRRVGKSDAFGTIVLDLRRRFGPSSHLRPIGAYRTAAGHKVVVAGDLNVLRGYGEWGSPYWKGRYDTIFGRMEALGLPLVGPHAPDGGRPPYPWPSELPRGSTTVPTFRTSVGRPETASRQLDFVFACAFVR